jgi:hypothetical protein
VDTGGGKIMPKIISIQIVNPLDKFGFSEFAVGLEGVTEIRVDCIDTPFVAIVFKDGSRQCFCGMPHTYKTEKHHEEEPF